MGGPPQLKASDGESDFVVQGSGEYQRKQNRLVERPFAEGEAVQSDSSESTEVAMSNDDTLGEGTHVLATAWGRTVCRHTSALVIGAIQQVARC